ncbi:MAG: AAA family ATPase [Candidatus Omnitrophica bacterium]|nr:AAA family ATPase [Candidatus Omnitrophota bacterium]
MLFNDELKLLIKSKYAVIAVESMDEDYVVRQLKQSAAQVELAFFQWSLTTGLRKGSGEGAYYQTKEPVGMIKMISSLLESEDFKPGLFVLTDFNKYFEDILVLRLFKDLVNQIKNTRNTIVLLAPEYKIPKDIEVYCAHIIGGYPVEQEMRGVIWETVEELKRTNLQIKVSLNPQEFDQIVKSLGGLTIQQIRNILRKCVLDDGALNIQDLRAIELCKKEIFDQEGLLEFCITEDKNAIANFSNLKRWISERKDVFILEKKSALPPPKGVLLMGVQGCGKSLAIKVIARELNLQLYRLDLGKLYSKYIGETEQNLRKSLSIVEKLCPLCLWIDEIEKGFATSGGDIDGGVSARILGTFLTWMQERSARCFIAATANNIYQLPPEFLRKGRFDEIFFIDLPDEETRAQLLNIHLSKRGLSPKNFDCKKLVALTHDFNGAEIEQVIISALYRATSEKETISTEHIIEQIQSTKPLAVLKAEEIADLRNWARERTISA